MTFFSQQILLAAPILAGEHPLNFILKQHPDISNGQLTLNLQKQGSQTLFFGRDHPNEEANKKFEEIVAQTIIEVKNDPSIIQVRKERESLAQVADSLKAKLRKKIEDPWNI